MLGVVVTGEGRARCRVWAPGLRQLLVSASGGSWPLRPIADGIWEGEAALTHGDDYLLVCDGVPLADPCSRWQPRGLRGPSRVLDPARFQWSDQGWAGVPLERLVISELHVGAFDCLGTFEGVARHLHDLADIGITAIELMPVATFPGRRGWGYDGLYTWAAHECYGGPLGLARLVDAAHAAGLAVILDVVYNHLGPGAEMLLAFGPYLRDDEQTPWGAAVDFSQPGVREWAIGNACQWVRDFHVDGLRIDAVHAIVDHSPRHVLDELADRVRAVRPGTLVISETEPDDLRPIRQWGHDAQWGDAFHHALHVLLTGEREGYYAGYGSVAQLAAELERSEREQLVVCSQNHDQVGNRAAGDRPPRHARRLAAMLTLLSPCTPLLFMGEEHGADEPFPFFSDHDDPEIARATREGRRREFAAFAAFAGCEVPDPQDERTFLSARLDRRSADPATKALFGELLALRRHVRGAPAEVEFDEAARWLLLRRGPIELFANFSRQTQLWRGEAVVPFAGSISER